MHLPYQPVIRSYTFGGEQIRLFVPDEIAVRQCFGLGKSDGDVYWTRLWPSAIALCEFLAARTSMMEGRDVWEFGAGLALPSMLAARYASSVHASDLQHDAVRYIRESALLNNYHHMKASVIDWSGMQLPPANLVLLSDVNYDPGMFGEVYSMINGFVEAGADIVLASPARITTAAFYEKLQHLIREQVTITAGNTEVAVWLLRGNQME